MWKLEDENGAYKILDKNKDIVGYFDPNILEFQENLKQSDSIDLHGEEKILDDIKKNKLRIDSGFITLPLAKFDLFNQDEPYSISYLHEKLEDVTNRISLWEKCLEEIGKNTQNWIQTSHTDSDMLSLTIFVWFNNPIYFKKDEVLQEIQCVLDQINQKGLL